MGVYPSMKHLTAVLTVVGLCAGYSLSSYAAETRDTLVRNDRSDVTATGKWIYNDLAKAFDEAKRENKPLLATVRCIPCVACKGFDARVLAYDPQIEDLMKKFVCVRIVQGNGMDLTLFQHDFDLSFAAYFLNPDRTIYGRFGSRSDHKDAEKDISIGGFRKAMEAALELHQQYPKNKQALAGKSPAKPLHSVPEEFPSLQKKYTAKLDYEGKVAGSCIHCHQVREAERIIYRGSSKPIPEDLLYPWPMPDIIGLALDPAEKAKVKSVASNSPAEQAKLRVGDEILSLNGQPMISIADVQWVLHRSPSTATVAGEVLRDGSRVPVRLNLPEGWRRKSDISWRPTSWDLRRMTTGGLVLKDTTTDERKKLNISESALALRVDYVGQYNEHAVGKKAGFQKNDVIVRIDGKDARMTESTLFAYLAENRMPGTRVPATVLRNGKEMELQLPMQ